MRVLSLSIIGFLLLLTGVIVLGSLDNTVLVLAEDNSTTDSSDGNTATNTNSDTSTSEEDHNETDYSDDEEADDTTITGTSDASNYSEDTPSGSDTDNNPTAADHESESHQDSNTITTTDESYDEDKTYNNLDQKDLSSLTVEPSVSFFFDKQKSNLIGDTLVSLQVDDARKVELFVKRPGTLIEYFIGTGKKQSNEKWQVKWNTKQTPNGTYTVFGKITNVFGTYEVTGPSIKVNNKTIVDIKTLEQNNQPPLPAEIRKEIEKQLEDEPSSQARKKEKVILNNPDNIDEEDLKLPSIVDSDNDGLTNQEELRIGSDPNNPDTDSDGYIDGLEVARGYNPLKPSPGDKIAFTEPKDSIGEVRSDIYRITGVRKVDKENAIIISGQARPLAFVVLYVYSELPTVITVRADETGKFEYELSKTLDDGEHQVFVALTDSNGLIVEKSEPLTFIKTAQAITVSDIPAVANQTPASPLQPVLILWVTLTIIALAFVLMVLMVSAVISKKGSVNTSKPSAAKLPEDQN